jgi:hypothetical protein
MFMNLAVPDMWQPKPETDREHTIRIMKELIASETSKEDLALWKRILERSILKN